MALSSQHISENYQHCLDFTFQLFQNKSRKALYSDQQEVVEMVQSVLGQESIVNLIKEFPFQVEKYKPHLIKAIDETQRLFFPDVSKKRFFSINDERYQFIEESISQRQKEQQEEVKNPELNSISEYVDSDLKKYFKEFLLKNNPRIVEGTIRFPKSKGQIDAFKKKLNRKIYLFQKFYPSGDIKFINDIDSIKSLSKNQIVNIYLLVYLGIERFFPKYFLQNNTNKRCAILVKFLVEEILESDPKQILQQKDETLFIKHKLQNVYRQFNYSFNRALGNAFPEIIYPWLASRVSSEFWQENENRVQAIQWLVEDKLECNKNKLYKEQISRKDFSKNGLSFLYNKYYNSVSAALAEAYPEKNAWEYGSVPFAFWNDENSRNAIKWLIEQKGWEIGDLPLKYQTKELNRKTFSEFGLATLFEKKFNKNIYKAISFVYPDQFYPWEFGKVSSKHWSKVWNIFQASKWLAAKEGIEEHNIVQSVHSGDLSLKLFSKYSIGKVLKSKCNNRIEHLFGLWFWKEHSTYLDEKRILKKIKIQNRKFIKVNVVKTLLYGLFAGEVLKNHHYQQRLYRRIQKRITTTSYE